MAAKDDVNQDKGGMAATGDATRPSQEGAGRADTGGMMGQAGSTMERGLGGAMRGAENITGGTMRFVDTTLTDTVHVVGHVASEVVTTTASVLGDVVGGVVDIFRRGFTGGYRGRETGYGGYGMSRGPTMGEEIRREESATR